MVLRKENYFVQDDAVAVSMVATPPAAQHRTGEF